MNEQDLLTVHALDTATHHLEKSGNAIERAGLHHLFGHIDSILADIQFERQQIMAKGLMVEYRK